MPIADAMFESAKRAFVADDMATAERLCRSIITMSPRDARPWIILTDITLRQGRAKDALVWAEKAVTLDRRDPFAHLGKVKCLISLGRLNEALEAAETGVRIKGCPAVALDEFGRTFSQLGRHRRSLEIIKMAVAAEPGNFLFLYNLAIAERTFGALEDAERHCDKVIALNPDFHRVYFIRADLRKQTMARNHIAEMEALIARGIRDAYGEVLVRFALAKECEDVGDDARAFRYIKSGGDLHRRHLRYNVQEDVSLIDRLIANQTRPALAAMLPGYKEDAPIFIVGLPRSGTTLVERIVSAHSEVTAAGELGAFTAELMRATGTDIRIDPTAWIARFPSLDTAALGAGYSRVARETGIPPGRRFTDKYPPNFLYCGAIHAVLPKAKIIAIKRNPMDTCFALYKAHFASGAYPYSYRLDELANYYLAFRRLMEHWKAILPTDSLLEVAYEDIVGDLEGQSRRILAFLNLPWQDEVLKFHASSAPATTASAVQVRQPIYTSSIGKWQRHADMLAPLHDRLAAEGIRVEELAG
jgi:tetratricopeptide (TPR) repeat protein